MTTTESGYGNTYTTVVTAGSAAASVTVLPAKSARVDVVHVNGSNAFIAFDGFLGSGANLNPYNGIASGTNSYAFATTSGNSVTYPIQTGSVQIIGSAGSPIGASTSTIRITSYW